MQLYTFWRPLPHPTQNYSGKQTFILKRQLRPKVTIKGMKFENSGFPLDFRSMFQMTHEGYTPTNFFNFLNSISSLFRGPICQILSFGAPHGDQQHHFAKKRYLLKSTFHQKNHWFLYLFSGTEIGMSTYFTLAISVIYSNTLTVT